MLSAAQYLSISGFLRHPHHLVPSSISAERYLAFLALLAIAWAPGIWRREPHRTVFTWCLTILALCAIGVVFVELIPIKLIIQLQSFRMTAFVQYFAVLYAADALLRLWHEGDWTAKLIALGTIAATAVGLRVGSALAVAGLRTTRFRALCFSLSGFAIALGFVIGWGPEFMGGDSATYKVRLMEQVISHIKGLSERFQVPLLLMFIPHPADASDDFDGPRLHVEDYPEYKRSGMTDRLQEIAERRHVPYVNLFDLFLAQPACSVYLCGGNDHWNEYGQKLAARLTADKILSNRLLTLDKGDSHLTLRRPAATRRSGLDPHGVPRPPPAAGEDRPKWMR